MPLQPGLLLHNRYKIIEVIAKGGMGALYRAYDESLAVEVALKENLFSAEDHTRQFHREATILAGLRHPNLPRVTDHFVIEGQGQYLVMDYIPGEDLKERTKRAGPLNSQETILVGIAISDALNYLHQRQPPILHRDIKLGNVKITPTGQIHLVDFGLARVFETGQATTTGAQALTPGFAPPEQYGQGTDPRSDIYALGATLYAAATGKVPEDGLTRAMGSTVLTPVLELAPTLSPRLAEVIEKAMNIDPGQRYQTAAEMKRALLEADTAVRRQVTEQEDVTITPPPGSLDSTVQAGTATVRPASRPLQPADSQTHTAPSRSLLWLGLGGLGVFILIVIIGVFALKLPARLLAAQNPTPTSSPLPPGASSTPTSTPLPDPSPPPAPTATALPVVQPTITFTPTPAPQPTDAATPSGGSPWIAFTSDRTGIPEIWIMRSDGSSPQQVTNRADGACQPDWSPDGKKLVFVTPCQGLKKDYARSGLMVLDLEARTNRPLDTVPGGDYEPAWSPDGTQIAFTSLRDGRPQLFLYNLADNSVVKLSPQATVDRQAAWSHDGSLIAFVTNRNPASTSQIWLMKADGSNAVEFSAQGKFASLPAWSPDRLTLIYSEGDSLPGLVARVVKSGSDEVTLNDTLRPASYARYSPDGYWVTFTFLQGGKYYLYKMNRSGGEVTPLTDDKSNNYDGVWRPVTR